jgi:hypothetical protein
VSLNAWGGAVFDNLSEWLPTIGCEILCLQEVTRTPGQGGWTTFNDAERSLPQRANLFDDVRRTLPDHQSWFVASDSGPVVDAAGVTRRQDFGLAIFVHEQLPVVAQASRYVHGSFVDHEKWTIADRPRIAQGLRVIDRDAAGGLSVVHFHGLRDPAGSTTRQLDEAKQIYLRRSLACASGSDEVGQPDVGKNVEGFTRWQHVHISTYDRDIGRFASKTLACSNGEFTSVPRSSLKIIHFP